MSASDILEKPIKKKKQPVVEVVEAEEEEEEEEEDEEEDVIVKKPTTEEIEDFKMRVSEWTKLDDQIRKLNIAVRERKTHQKALSDGIQTFMSSFGYDNLNTTQGRIIHTVRKTKQPFKIGEIRTLLENEKTLTGSELFKAIFETERPIIEKQSIRRVIPKVSMSLEI